MSADRTAAEVVTQPAYELPGDLWTQSTARAYAHALNAAGDYPAGFANVAHAIPERSWGGAEAGWTVSLRPVP